MIFFLTLMDFNLINVDFDNKLSKICEREEKKSEHFLWIHVCLT